MSDSRLPPNSERKAHDVTAPGWWKFPAPKNGGGLGGELLVLFPLVYAMERLTRRGFALRVRRETIVSSTGSLSASRSRSSVRRDGRMSVSISWERRWFPPTLSSCKLPKVVGFSGRTAVDAVPK